MAIAKYAEGVIRMEGKCGNKWYENCSYNSLIVVSLHGRTQSHWHDNSGLGYFPELDFPRFHIGIGPG